ncbi:MAG: hypothetical protein J6S78_08795 [Lachnospiraceae bacterium]|nr:hypothetical protein [Lachnospiraceae bacterium]
MTDELNKNEQPNAADEILSENPVKNVAEKLSAELEEELATESLEEFEELPDSILDDDGPEDSDIYDEEEGFAEPADRVSEEDSDEYDDSEDYVAAESEADDPEEEDQNEALTEREMFLSLRRKKLRKQAHMVLQLMLVGVMIVIGYLAFYYTNMTGWHDSSKGRSYIVENNRVTGMQRIDGRIYIFDSDGYLIEGPAEVDGKIYYSSAEGTLTGAVEIDGETYCFSETDGTLNRGFYTQNGSLYYRNSHGFIEDGVREIDGHVYYIAKDGRILHGWAQNDKGMRYFCEDDSTMVRGLYDVDGDTYYFDWNGYARKGFIKDGEVCYYAAEPNGAMIYGRQIIDGKEYYLTEDGAILNGIASAEGKDWYFIDNVFQSGWIEDETGSFYCTQYGLVKGPQEIDGKSYYFEDDYRLARGWITRDDGRYYFDNEGVMLTGWQKIDDKNYCFSDKGVLYVGEATIEGEKYLFAEDGAYYDGFIETELGKQYYVKGYLQTGVTKIDNKYYYLNENGIPTGGMQMVNGVPGNYNADGSAAPGWKTIDNKKYYFGPDGVMMRGNVAIGNKRYYLSKDGGFLEAGWHTDGGKMYCYADGTIAVGAVKIDGVLYGFNDSGYLITKEGLQKVGGKQRYVYSSGKLAVSTQVTVGGRVYVVDANGVATVKFGTITDANLDEYLKYVVETEVGSRDITTLANWVRKKIAYYSYYSSGSKGIRTLAIEGLNKGCGACWHYASLMTLVLRAAGYEAKVIKGGGHSYAEHNWTAVYVGGVWKYVDAMRNSSVMTQAQLDAVTFYFTDPNIGPRKGQCNYTDKYYYGYSYP